MGEHHLIGVGADFGDKQPPSGGDPQAPALADGVVVEALVGAQDVAVGVHKVPRRGGAAPGVQPGGVVVVGDEADLHGVGAVGGGQLPSLRLLAGLLLGAVPQGEENVGEHVPGQPGEHVGLVIGGIAPQQNGAAVAPGANAGIVSGGHPVGPDFPGKGDEGGELHRPVAHRAGNGGAAGQVVGGKGGAHVLLQLPLDGAHGEGDAQFGSVVPGGLFAPQPDVQVQPVHLIALAQEPLGGYGGIHPAGEPQNHLLVCHVLRPPVEMIYRLVYQKIVNGSTK